MPCWDLKWDWRKTFTANHGSSLFKTCFAVPETGLTFPEEKSLFVVNTFDWFNWMNKSATSRIYITFAFLLKRDWLIMLSYNIHQGFSPLRSKKFSLKISAEHACGFFFWHDSFENRKITGLTFVESLPIQTNGPCL